MTVATPTNPQLPQNSTSSEEKKQTDKEFNFRQLEAKFEKQLAQERAARADLEKQIAENLQKQKESPPEDDDDNDFVDHKKLSKKLASFGEQTKKQTQAEIQRAVSTALAEERKQSWLKSNSDFFDVMQHAEKFAEKDPELAETILQMPDGFERQKLVYKTIKAMGLHAPEQKKSSIQETVDANRRSPYYQPSGVGTAPYAAAGDFTPAGQKNAYQKMQDLKKRLGV